MEQEQVDTVKLAQELKAGSESAKALLYTRYKAYFSKLAYKYVNNVDDTDDVVCDSFVRIFRYIGQLKDDNYLVAWCGRVVTTTALNYIKKRKYEQYQKDVTVVDPGRCNDTHSPMDLQMVMKCIDNLAPGYKRVVELFCIEGLSGPEIAEELSMKQVTVRSQLYKARKALKKAMRYEY
jgi:RNA polymerase sigma factor (sigma-70 family)